MIVEVDNPMSGAGAAAEYSVAAAVVAGVGLLAATI